MKILASVIAIAVLLAWPTVGEAASKKKKKSKARSAPIAQQFSGPYSVPGSRTRAGTPCVAYTWEGCLGWDPDPNVRSQLPRDFGDPN